MSAVDAIAVLDYGSQYTQLIARRIREMSVYSEILPPTVSLESLRAAHYKGIILSGGPASVYEEQAPVAPTALFELGVPVLGICYGMQIMAYRLGGRVVPVDRREYGKAVVQLHAPSALLRGITPDDGRLVVWMSHGDTVLAAPPGFAVLASTDNCPVAAMADDERRLCAHARGGSYPRELPGQLPGSPDLVDGVVRRHHGRGHPRPGG